MQNNRILSSLGLAQKAGCIASGEYAVEKAVKGGLASLVIVAEDASDETPLYVYGSKDDLGHCIGKEYRSMVAVLQPGFAKSVMKQLDNRPTTE